MFRTQGKIIWSYINFSNFLSIATIAIFATDTRFDPPRIIFLRVTPCLEIS